jgi:hypothetical protein
MSLADLVQLVSSVALVVSVLFLAWQTQQVASATRLASRTAIADAMSDAAGNVRAGGTLQSRAQTLCEMMCDAAEASLEVAARVPGADDALGGWPDWARWVLAGSPGSTQHVLAHPSWYPRLVAIQVSVAA